MKKHLAERGYKKANRDGYLDNFIWNYALLKTVDELDKSREKLLNVLRQPEVDYIEKNWVPKEDEFIDCYTFQYSNLGSVSTQRGEGFHAIVKQRLKPQIQVGDATKRIVKSLKEKFKNIFEAESHDRKNFDRLLDVSAFKLMMGKVSYLALKKMFEEWESLKSEAKDKEVGLPCIQNLAKNSPPSCDFNCQLPLRFGLPCEYYLAKAFVEGLALPLSLIYLRWLIGGPLDDGSWRMSYGTVLPAATTGPEAEDHYRNHGRNLILKTSHGVLGASETLTGEAADHCAYLYKLQNDALVNRFKHHQEQQVQMLAVLPNRIESSKREFKKHGNTSKRGMTGLEAAEADESANTRIEKRKAAREKRKAKKLKDRHRQEVDEQIMTESFVEALEKTPLTAPAKIGTEQVTPNKRPTSVSSSPSSSSSSALSEVPEDLDWRRSGRERRRPRFHGGSQAWEVDSD